MIDGMHYAKAVSRSKRVKTGLTGLTLTDLSGRTYYGETRGAEIIVGRGVDMLADLVGRVEVVGTGKRLGFAIGFFEKLRGTVSARSVDRFAIALRAKQTGDRMKANATFRRVAGIYKGNEEYTSEVVFLYTGDAEDTFEAFEDRMVALGEQLAYAFAQETVYVKFTNGGKITTEAASPVGFPPPDSADYTRLVQAIREKIQGGAHLVKIDDEGIVK